MRVLGIDPGLTRCGVGVVELGAGRRVRFVDVEVVRSSTDDPLATRLTAVGDRLARLYERHRPDAVAIEQVFAQHNVRTVMSVAQLSGVALYLAQHRGIATALYTPSEVKSAVTGYGGAGKRQVQAMVARILGLDAAPRPADAADALALAICHGWRSASTVADTGGPDAPTPAQRAWRAAEASARTRGAARRLGG